MIRRSVLFLSALSSPFLGLAQSTGRPERATAPYVERLVEDAMTEGREAFLVDALARLRENPLDINDAAEDELSLIPGMNPALARRIVEQRARTAYEKVDDLRQIEGMDDALLALLKPFIFVRTAEASGSGLSSVVRLRTRVSRSLSDRRAAKSEGYLGSPEKLYSRLAAKVVKPATLTGDGRDRGLSDVLMELGVLTEKDPGEPNYTDFVSAYAHVDLPASGFRFILGDFGVDAAHGEVFSSSGMYARRSDALSSGGHLKEGVRPSLASESSENYRGGALSWTHDRFTVSLFASSRKRDATIDSNGVVTTWDDDGYHRTERELGISDLVRENVLGARARMLVAGGLTCGVSWYSMKFNRSVLVPETEEIHSSTASVIGLDIAFTGEAATFSAELAQRMGVVQSCVLSCSWSPEKSFTTSLLLRAGERGVGGSEDKELGRSSGNKGSSFGATCAVRIHPATWLRVSASYDQSRLFEQASANVLPATGCELILNAECRPTKKIELELRYREKVRPVREILLAGNGLYARVDGTVNQTQARASIVVNLMNSIQSRSRLELSQVGRRFGAGIDRGLMMYQECSFDVLPWLSVSLRGIAFETANYDSRIYEFEEDVPGAFQNPALYGRGFRWFVRGEFECGSWLSCSVKYAQSEMQSTGNSGTAWAAPQFRQDECWSVQLDLSW